MKRALLESNENVSRSKVLIEATDEYKKYCIQKAKIERAVELIRLAKIMSRTTLDEVRGY